MNKCIAIAAIVSAIATAVRAQYYTYPAQGNDTTYHTGANGAAAGREAPADRASAFADFIEA